MTTQAYIMYQRERIDVTIDSFFIGGNGQKMCNVTAVNGYPFNGNDIESQGEFYANTMKRNGYRVRADFVKVEITSHDVDSTSQDQPHAVELATELEAQYQPTDTEQAFVDDWCDERDTIAAVVAGMRG